MEVNGVLHVPSALTPAKKLPMPIGQEAGWTPEPVWTLWSREVFSSAGNWTSAVQLVEIPTGISQLIKNK
jgi:hypothetical protein